MFYYEKIYELIPNTYNTPDDVQMYEKFYIVILWNSKLCLFLRYENNLCAFTNRLNSVISVLLVLLDENHSGAQWLALLPISPLRC